MTILDHYAREKQRFLEDCTQCGLCAEGCPIIPYTDVREMASGDIQKGVFDFMNSGIPNHQAYTKAFACMECFKCTAGICPEDLNPMLINELIKSRYIGEGLANKAYGDPRQPDSTHRVLASVQVSRAEDLVPAIGGFEPEVAVFWCPTCQYRFDKSIVPAMDIPFKILSFPQYLAANMSKLPLTRAAAGTVTLHEACKSAFTGLDLDGPREVLRQLPGVTLTEMKHHSCDTICCGSGAICWFPESCARIREERLQEAEQTGAEHLVTVCHYCNQTFAEQGAQYDFLVTSYVNLVAEAMGIRRDDKFNRFTQWGDLDVILKDAEKHIAGSPFERERIIEVLQSVFIR